jgi:hypothetical protein
LKFYERKKLISTFENKSKPGWQKLISTIFI